MLVCTTLFDKFSLDKEPCSKAGHASTFVVMSESTEETEEKLKLEIDKEIEKLKYYLEQADDIIKEGDFCEIEVINKRTETPRAETWSGNSQSDISMEKGYKGKVHSIGPTMFANDVNIDWKYCPTSMNLADQGSTHDYSMHLGTSNTMAAIRDKCSAKPFGLPIISALPRFRTEGSRPFEVTGIDFAGPLHYKIGKGEQGKCYVLIFTCAASRAIHLELTKTQTAEEFQRKLNAFISRRTRPRVIISDNAATFKATADWIKLVRRNEKLLNFLAQEDIRWQFNLAKSHGGKDFMKC